MSGTQSVCFLSCDRQNSDKLRLSILSRSQGKDLHGFVFKPGSIVAMTIMAHIAVEAATLVYEELRFASVSLRQKSIWTLLSSHQTPSPSAAQSAFFSSPEASLAALGIELLSLCSVYPILSYLNAEHDNIQSIFRNVPSILHPLRCCQYMQQDSTFSPCWDWEVPANSKSDLSPLSHHQFLFYLDSANMFLCITVIDGQDWNVDLVQQGPLHSTLVSNDKQHSSAFPVAHSTKGAVAKVVNFILHSLWSDVANL